MILVDDRLLAQVHAIALRAGAAVMEVYASEFAVRLKDGGSPVTAADERSEALIVAALETLTPGVPIVAEERFEAGIVPDVGNVFWLVDPLDGTKEFLSRNGEFTVNIALIQSGVPVLGVVHAPARGDVYGGIKDGGAYVEDVSGRRVIRCRAVPAEGMAIVASRSHGDAAALSQFLGERKVASITSAGSSLKLCLVASGQADLYPRLGRTMEWDIAAGHAVVFAAGGEVRDLKGAPLRYGKLGFENPHFVTHGLIT